MKKVIFVLLSSLLFSCEENESQKQLNLNQCSIEYIENFKDIPNQGHMFQWDTVTHLRTTTYDSATVVHLIEAVAFEADSAKKWLKIYILDSQFKEGTILLGEKHFSDPALQYSRYIRDYTQKESEEVKNHFSGVVFFNKVSKIEIIKFSSEKLLVKLEDVDIYALSDQNNYPPAKLTITTNFTIDK